MARFTRHKLCQDSEHTGEFEWNLKGWSGWKWITITTTLNTLSNVFKVLLWFCFMNSPLTPLNNWNKIRPKSVIRLRRGSLSINALRACVYIYIRQLSSFRAPTLWLSIWLSLLAIFNTLFWVYFNLFHEKTDKTRKYVWYENGRRRYSARKALILRKPL